MTAFRLVCDAVFSLGAGFGLAEVLQLRLRLIERVLVALVTALVLAPAASFGLALIFGLNAATALIGPALLLAACAGILIARAEPLGHWRASLRESWTGWQARSPWGMLGVAAFAAVVFALIFSHTLFTTGGDLTAGFQTVWADWSQHLSTETSFAVASNVASTNPLFAGTPLLYPFIADFQSATLVALGLSPQAALALPGAMLAVIIALLIIRLARRLGLGMGAGMVAAAITFIGGGLGFAGVLSDACTNAGYTAAQCSLGHVFGNPGDGWHVITGTLHSIPGIVAAQPRAYDGLLTAATQQPFPNMQWYTPLFAWWLPQRTMLYGFAVALCILLVLIVAIEERPRSWAPFAVAGVFMGVMPLVHVQTMIALGIVLVIVALVHRRAEWLAFAGVAAVIAFPRLLQIALAPHGSAAFGNAYPWLEPGWLSNAVPHSSPTGFASAVAYAVGGEIRSVLAPSWWGFWFVNLGVAVPLCATVAIAAALQQVPGKAGVLGHRLLSPFPRPVLELALAALVVFLLCNFIVFQSWDWDNTKLLVLWYFTAGLLAGALAAHWWRKGFFRSLASAAVVTSMLLTRIVVLLRVLPWTPPQDAVGGPYTVASADERALAATVAARTPGNAVFLTYGRPNDPVLAISGRTGLMGYYGWLWSYGTNFGTRVTDIQTMYRGCSGNATGCPIFALLRKYHVSYVEIDDRADSPGAIEPAVNPIWWAGQGFPVVASSQHIVVYDVRHQ